MWVDESLMAKRLKDCLSERFGSFDMHEIFMISSAWRFPKIANDLLRPLPGGPGRIHLARIRRSERKTESHKWVEQSELPSSVRHSEIINLCKKRKTKLGRIMNNPQWYLN